MSRRRLVALISAGILLLIGMSVVGAVLATTQTDLGRARLRSLINAQVTSAMGNRGTMYIGRITGSLFTGVEIDSIAIRDEEDSLVVATGPIIIRYDPRDVIDKRLLLSYFEVNRPNVYLRRRADHQWSFRHVFPDGKKTQRLAGSRSYGRLHRHGQRGAPRRDVHAHGSLVAARFAQGRAARQRDQGRAQGHESRVASHARGHQADAPMDAR